MFGHPAQYYNRVRTFRLLSEPQLQAIVSKMKEAAMTGKFQPFKTTTKPDGGGGRLKELLDPDGWPDPAKWDQSDTEHVLGFSAQKLKCGSVQRRNVKPARGSGRIELRRSQQRFDVNYAVILRVHPRTTLQQVFVAPKWIQFQKITPAPG
jgi:hypothetical protein